MPALQLPCQVAARASVCPLLDPERNSRGSLGQYWLIYSLLCPCPVCSGLAGSRQALLPKLLFSPFFSFSEVTVFILSLPRSLHAFCSLLMPAPERAHIKSGQNALPGCHQGRWRVLGRRQSSEIQPTEHCPRHTEACLLQMEQIKQAVLHRPALLAGGEPGQLWAG